MSSRKLQKYLAALIFACALGQGPLAPAATTNLYSIADTTLSEEWSSNNLGHLQWANAGTTQNFKKNRALFKFDVAGVIPPHSKIRSATLVLEVTKEPVDGFNFADFGPHRVLRDWGEGNKTTTTNSPNPGQGALATTNEATWFSRFAFTTNTWAVPGGGGTSDYVAAPSALNTIYGMVDSPYSFSSAQTVADVQLWLDQPQNNFGWILVCESEGTDFTARRFGTHEDPNFQPYVLVDYTPPPHIDSAQKIGNEFTLSFVVQPGQTYVVEYCDALAASIWQPLAYMWTPTEAARFQVTDTTDVPQRFYRLEIVP